MNDPDSLSVALNEDLWLPRGVLVRGTIGRVVAADELQLLVEFPEVGEIGLNRDAVHFIPAPTQMFVTMARQILNSPEVQAAIAQERARQAAVSQEVAA